MRDLEQPLKNTLGQLLAMNRNCSELFTQSFLYRSGSGDTSPHPRKDSIMRNVFIPSIPTRHDKATGQRVPTIDVNPAASFGQLVLCCPDEEELDVQQRIDKLRQTMYSNATGNDVVVCSGDLLLVGAALTYLSDMQDEVHALRWCKHERRYQLVTVTI